MKTSLRPALASILLLLLTANQGCTPFHVRGIEKVRSLEERYYCGKVSVLPPQVEGIRYLQRSVFPWAFEHECSAYYNMKRKGRIWNFGFAFEVLSAGSLPLLNGSLDEIAEAIIRERDIKYEHDVKHVKLHETLFEGHPAVRFEFARIATYTGNFGTETVEIGYLIPHPCGESWVAIYYTDSFRESAGESPDLESRRIGEEFLNSLRIHCDEPVARVGPAKGVK